MSHKTRRWRTDAQIIGSTLFLCLSLLAVAALFPPSSPIHAHGGGTPQLSDVEAGPYRLFAWTEPEPWRTGEVHVTVAVTLAAEDHADDDDHEHPALPADDVKVTVRFFGPGGSEESTILGSPHASLGAGYFETDTAVDEVGEWRVQIDLSGSEGSGSAQFAVDVLPARSFPWLWVVGALLLVIVTGLLLWRVRRPQAEGAPRRAMVDIPDSEDGNE
jgi:hypothetical protein